MGRGDPARRPAGGGGGIQALRQARTRLTLAVGSALAYAAVLAYGVWRAGNLRGLAAAIGVLGAVLLGAVLLRGVQELLSWSLGVLGGAYAVSIGVHGGSVDEAVPLVAVGLLLCGELAAWSLDERVPIDAEPGVHARRATAIGTLAGAGLVAATAVVAIAAAPAGNGLAWTGIGAAAAVGAVGIGVAVARRSG
jgi:hypothetical protein